MRPSLIAAVAAVAIGTTPANAVPTSATNDLRVAKAVVQDASLSRALAGDLPNPAYVETRPLRATDCTAYPELVSRDPLTHAACRDGRFLPQPRTHCTAAAGITDSHLRFDFYIGAMGFFTYCGGTDLILACYGLIAGVGAPPGGYGPGFPGNGTCTGATTPWLSRHTQTYSAVVVVHTLLGGPSISIFTLSH